MMDVADSFSAGDKSAVGNHICESSLELQKALRAHAENTLNRVGDDVFIDIYKKCLSGFQKRDDVKRPSLAGSSIEAKKYRKQFNQIVLENISETIEETFLTMINAKLEDLEELKKDQTDTSLAWRPPSDAKEHMIPFEIVSRLEEKKELLKEIEKESEVMKLLKGRLVQKRLKAKELYEMLQNLQNKIENQVVREKNKS